SDWSPRQRAKGATGGPEAGAALATRLREDMAMLLEMGPPRPGQELAPKEQRERFQHALAVLTKVRRGPQLEEALLLACTTVDRHLVRFVGAELEAAAALLSILATESSARCAKAMAAKVAYETAQAGGAAAGSGPAKHKQQEEEEEGRLPLSVLVAAVRSLRTLSASAVATEKSVRISAACPTPPGGGGGRGPVSARVGPGGPSASRLVRYLTRECDKVRGITAHPVVERNLDALMSELRSWSAGLGSAAADGRFSAPAVSTGEVFQSKCVRLLPAGPVGGGTEAGGDATSGRPGGKPLAD
ncbi:unnamed protein product, partial [Ectocarpus sp. 12 AP-2014]